MNLVEQVEQAGVVGAGGGGFPTHVKLAAKADTVIANGAECEPLLHKDATIMEEQAAAAAAKAAAVELLEIRLAMALGGKAFCTMTGEVASVQTAVGAGRQVIADAGMLVNAVVISRLHRDVYREIV